MSVQAMAWVLESSKSRLAARLVLLSIANHANADGVQSWPSIPTIAREAHVSERQAQRSLQELAALGELWIEPGGGRGKSNAYQVLIKGDKLSPGGVTSCPVKGDKSGSAIRMNRPEPSKPLTPPTPLLQRGELTQRQIRKVETTIQKRKAAWVGLSPAKLRDKIAAIAQELGLDALAVCKVFCDD